MDFLFRLYVGFFLSLILMVLQPVHAGTITEHFDTDPGWTSFNLPSDGNDFGYRNSNYAGGDAGEIGGLFSRTDEVSWYGDDDVGLLGENDTIQASGLINIRSVQAGYNNNTHVGHFDSDGLSTFVINGIGFQILEENTTSPFSFRIFYTIGNTEGLLFEINGVDESRNWSYLYDPNDGDFGSLTVSISGAGGDTAKRFLTAGQRASIGNLNVFGLAEMDNSNEEPPQAEIYVDDVIYTVAFEMTEHTVHEITDAKLKATFIEDGKTKTETIKKKELGSLLCGGRDLDKKEKLALYAPCPAATILDTQSVFLGVYNKDTGENVCDIESIVLEEPLVEFKENAIDRITALFFGDIAAEIGEDLVEVGLFGSIDATTKFVKDGDLSVDGLNCFHKVKTKSVSGSIEQEGVDDAVIVSGKLKAGKVKETISGSDIVDEVCGIDCEL